MRTGTFMKLATVFTVALAAPAAYAGIPQLDPTWFASQLFWLVVSFGVMLVLVRVAIAPSVEDVLSTRKNAITSAMREAESYRNQAARANQDMDASISDAKAKAASMNAQVQAEASQRAAESMQVLDKELKEKISKAELTVANAKATAMGELQEHAANLTKAIVEKLVDVNVNASDALSAMRKVS